MRKEQTILTTTYEAQINVHILTLLVEWKHIYMYGNAICYLLAGGRQASVFNQLDSNNIQTLYLFQIIYSQPCPCTHY